MTKALISQENSKKQNDNIQTPFKTSITQRLRTDLGRSFWIDDSKLFKEKNIIYRAFEFNMHPVEDPLAISLDLDRINCIIVQKSKLIG